MRTIGTTEDAIAVNGRPFFARGVIRGREAHDHPNLAGLPLEEFYAKYIRAAKAYGFNLIRFHSRVPPDEYFAAADRLGVFTHIEIRPYFGRYQKDRKFLNDAIDLIDEDAWRDTIIRLRNHPSLMVICVGNEIRHPGTNPQVAHLAEVAKELDPTRLFLDTCAHGEYDRTYVDFDVQHMSYYYPFGVNWTMFENRQNWLIYGSCKDLPVDERGDGWRVTRALAPKRPVLGHEVCHYVALRDLDALAEKFEACDAETPWWIGELKKLVKEKGLEDDYELMRQASKRFQFIGWKLGIEAVRRSPVLAGLHFLQLADTDLYENSNGLLDCFDDPTGIDPERFSRFNGDAVLLADLPRRTYFEGETVTVPVLLSHFSPEIGGMADLHFALEGSDLEGGLASIDLDERGRRTIAQITLTMPKSDGPAALKLVVRLTGDGVVIENDWDMWVYPNQPGALPAVNAAVQLDEIDLSRRYPQIAADEGASLLLTNRFTQEVFDHLAGGGDVLMLYRVPATRDRKTPAEPEEFYLPATWDRFKSVVWDRGHNLGAFVRDTHAFDGFPNDGFLDLQFHGLVDDCDKIILDGFPCAVDPIMQGVDKACRDRFDVYTYGLSELEPDRTLRKFAYAFELRVGEGRLFVTGLNFTGLNSGVPETCAMFESLARYVTSEAFQPAASAEPETLAEWLREKGSGPVVKERRMTQYWQLNEEPLESAQYWKDSLEYLDEPIVQEDAF
jgi:beta-galactosidase